MGCTKGDGVDPPPPPPMDTSLVTWYWETEVPEWISELQCGPVLYKDWIIVANYETKDIESDLYLTVFDKHTGEIAWKWQPSGQIQIRPINIKRKEQYLIMSTYDGLICLDLESQTMVWEHVYNPLKIYRYAFEIYGDHVLISNKLKTNGSSLPYTDSIEMMRLNIYDGSKEHVFGKKMVEEGRKTSSFHAALQLSGKDHVIFVNSYLSPDYEPRDEEVLPDIICYDMEQEEIVWSDTAFCEVHSCYNIPPIEYGETVIAQGDWSLYCYNKHDGRLLWRHEFEHTAPFGGFLFSGPKLYNGMVYCIDDGGVLYAVDASSGQRRWTNVLPGEVGQIRFGPASHPQDHLLIEDGILWVNSWGDKDMILFDIRTGKELERFTDANYSGEDILYDEETDRYFVTTYGSVKSFSLKK